MKKAAPIWKKDPARVVFLACGAVGLAAFIGLLAAGRPERAWQAYLINFLLWSAVAQGAVLFATVIHITKARWSGPLAGLAESFAAFFPISFVLFLVLFLGKSHVFPWLHHDLHGKEAWLNLPFLFSRDLAGLLLLYGTGFGFLYHSMQLRAVDGRIRRLGTGGKIREWLLRPGAGFGKDPEDIRRRMSVFSVIYILSFAFVGTLIGFDLIMSMDPHWLSTLFGAYIFVKAFYIGLGGLIILAAVVRIRQGEASGILPAHFHDLGKLFFAFCLMWGDFFYAQLVVIWYGNLSEETSYVIERTLNMPWRPLAWTVFTACFIIPFVILLNRKVKTKPRFMTVLCAAVIAGIWLEHLLLLGPAFSAHATSLPVGLWDALISVGFLGLLAYAVQYYLGQFPELSRASREEAA